MDQIKQLTNAIDQCTSDMLSQPTPSLYGNVEKLLSSRADMSKHLISYVSKRLMIKNKKVLFLTMDLLQYLSYQTELSFYSQIATKDFLMLVSRLLQSKDIEQPVASKILCVVKCWEELFKPHQDLLPMFFQFYDGLIKKGFDSKAEYTSPYRPKELKKYPSKTEQKRPSSARRQEPPKRQPIRSEPVAQTQSLSSIRQQIVLTNEVIDGCDPAEGVQANPLLTDLMTGLKEAQKRIMSVINEETNQKLIEESIALNDDLIITFRRYKDLQKNRKPEPFVKTELSSNYVATSNSPPSQPKAINSPLKKPPSIFEEFAMQSSSPPIKNSPTKIQVPKPQPKPQPVANIMDLDFESPKPTVQQPSKPATQPPPGANLFDLMDLQPSVPATTNATVPQRRASLNSGAFDLLGAPSTNPSPSPPKVNPIYNSYNSGVNQFGMGLQPMPPAPMPPAPIGNINLMGGPMVSGLGMAPVGTLPGQNINFDSLPYQKANNPSPADMKQYHQNSLTDLSDWFSKK